LISWPCHSALIVQVVTREEDIVKAEHDTEMDEAGPRVKVEVDGQQGTGVGRGVAGDAGAARPGQLGAVGRKGGAAIKMEPSVKGEPGEPRAQSGAGVSTVASKGFAGANAGVKPVGALTSGGEFVRSFISRKARVEASTMAQQQIRPNASAPWIVSSCKQLQSSLKLRCRKHAGWACPSCSARLSVALYPLQLLIAN